MRFGAPAALACLFRVCSRAHAGEPLQPDDLWTAWEFDPGVVIPLVVAAVLYAVGSRRHVGTDAPAADLFLGGLAQSGRCAHFAAASAWRSLFSAPHGAARRC